MDTVKVGAVLAAVIAGPPLYALVDSGGLDTTAALERGAVVMVACAFGASWIVNLARSYENEAKREQESKERRIHDSLEGLVPDEPADGAPL
jgi:hypothetical protein